MPDGLKCRNRIRPQKSRSATVVKTVLNTVVILVLTRKEPKDKKMECKRKETRLGYTKFPYKYIGVEPWGCQRRCQIGWSDIALFAIFNNISFFDHFKVTVKICGIPAPNYNKKQH